MSLRRTWKYSRGITLMSLPVWRHLSLCILVSLPCLDLFLLTVLFYLTHSKLVTCLLATYFEASGSEFVVIFRKRVWFQACFPVTIVTGMGRPWWAGPGSLSIPTARVREGNFNWQRHQHHNRSEWKRKSLPELSRKRTGELDRKNAHLPHSK